VALGIAASMASGLRENFGTMTKPLHSGRAASVDGRLGRPFFLLDPGVSIKPYPSGSLAHPAMDVMLDLTAGHDLRPGQIERIEVAANSNVPNALIHHRPVTGLQGKFSMEYCIATCVVRRRAGLAEFTDAAVLAPEIQDFLGKVDLVVAPDLEAMGYQHVRSRVTVTGKDGSVVAGEAEWARGYPAKPMTPAELTAKFTECAAEAIPAARAVEAAAAISGLEGVGSITAALALLS